MESTSTIINQDLNPDMETILRVTFPSPRWVVWGLGCHSHTCRRQGSFDRGWSYLSHQVIYSGLPTKQFQTLPVICWVVLSSLQSRELFGQNPSLFESQGIKALVWLFL